MNLKVFFVTVLFLFPRNCFSQECEGFEQSAFNYFVQILVKENVYFNGKKIAFHDTLQKSYSRFRLENAIASSDQNLKLDNFFIAGVAKAANKAEQQFENESYCKNIKTTNLSSFFKHKLTRKRIFLKIYKATKLGDVHYVQITCIAQDRQWDYVIELNPLKTITKWFMQYVMF